MYRSLLLSCLFLIFFIEVNAQRETDHQNEKVIGGEIVEAGEYPWMISLVMSDGTQGCGASLIAPQWVLTAGHCIIDFPGAPQVEQVIINSLITDATSLEPYSELIEIEDFFVHEGFNFFSQGSDDIALIRLSEPAITEPVELAELSDSLSYSHHMPGKVLGWGRMEAGGQNSDVLRVGNLFFFNTDTCSTLYDASSTGNQIAGYEDSKLCAGYYSGIAPVGAAQGDSGGPLFFDDNGTYKQIGVVSGGNSDITTVDFPGIFTFIPFYSDWMEDIMSQYDNPTSTTSINQEELSIKYFANQFVRINDLNNADEYSFEVYDLAGRNKAIAPMQKGPKSVEFLVSEFDTGLYILVIQNHTKGYLSNRKLFIY